MLSTGIATINTTYVILKPITGYPKIFDQNDYSMSETP